MKIKIPENYIIRILLFGLFLTLVYYSFEGLGFVINDNYFLTVLTMFAINTILALGLNLVTGVTGQLSLGHAAFMSIGAYAGAIATMKFDLPFSISLIVAGTIAAIFGILIGYPILRLTGDYLAIATLGFGEIIRVVFNGMTFTNGALGISGIPRYTHFALAWTVAVLAIILMVWLNNSRSGRAMMAIRDNEIAAESMGINTTLYKIQSFAVGSFLGGVGGALLAHLLRYIKPDMFGFMKSIDILMMVVLGGMGSVPGTILGAGVLTIALEALRFFSDYRNLFYGGLLVIMMIYRPYGLLGGVNLRKVVRRAFSRKTKPELKKFSR